MDRNFQKSLKLVLKHEGGWSDHPKDPGGATMKGITIAVYREHIKPNGTKNDLRNITDEQVATIYRKQYWDKVRGDDLPSGVDYAVFDFAVNSGVSRAAKYLQAIAGVAQDGIVGTQTLTAVGRLNSGAVINNLCDRRMSFLRGLSTFATFGRGWTSRVSGVRSEALRMAGSAPVSVPAPQPDPAPTQRSLLQIILDWFRGK